MNIPSRAGAVGPLTRRAALLALIALIGAGLAFFMFRAPVASPAVVTKVTIAVPMQISSAPMIVAAAKGLFQEAGVEPVFQPVEFGKDALNAVLQGKADLAVVADTPLMFALLNGADIALLAGITQGRRSLAIVTRNDRGIREIRDLPGKSVGLTLGTNLTYFLDAMLQVNRVQGDSVHLVDLRTDELTRAFKEGRLDAAVVYQPFLAKLQAEMGEQIKVFYGEDVYSFRFFVAGKPSYIDSHTSDIRRVLRALVKSSQMIHANPVEARLAVGDALKIDDAIMARLFRPEDYVVSLDQAMLLALDDQSRWAMKQGLAKTIPMPNYLHAMKYQDLEAVQPSAVTIVR